MSKQLDIIHAISDSIGQMPDQAVTMLETMLLDNLVENFGTKYLDKVIKPIMVHNPGPFNRDRVNNLLLCYLANQDMPGDFGLPFVINKLNSAYQILDGQRWIQYG